MCISARDGSLFWPMHALLYVCSCLKELALLSHSQLVAGTCGGVGVRMHPMHPPGYRPVKGFLFQPCFLHVWIS